MPQVPGDHREWQRRVEQMRQARNAVELAEQHGQPHHKQKHGAMEIWHYPLGILDGTLYSAHAAILADQSLQVYMHMEPATGDAPAPRRPWWRFW
jgi:hypothetical protein